MTTTTVRLSPVELEAIRAAWSIFDAARDRGDLATARTTLAGLEARALALGLPSVWALSNR